jgi:fido (protein-threonine AMPylation protein)
MRKKPSELDFEEYIRQVEPAKREKSYAWSTAIGLQQVDGLTPSDYLLEIAKKNIEGEISLNKAQALIDSYYESKTERTEDQDETEEADKVSARIAQVLSEKAFSFSPSFLIAIHKRLFDRVFKHAGEIRKYNISKKEWVLNGDSVMYGASFELRMALDYDFEREREFNYSDLSMDEIVRHLSSFVSRLWQIHAFGEGNTRTTAVFTIKYLRSMGFKVGNDIFAKNSWYFRNALVRANYKNVAKGIQQEPEYLEKFFRNLLMGERNELKNRYLHVDYKKTQGRINTEKSSSDATKKCGKNVPINVLINVPIKNRQKKIVAAISKDPHVSATKLAEKFGVTEKTIRRDLLLLKQQNMITRVGANKNGCWKVAKTFKED